MDLRMLFNLLAKATAADPLPTISVGKVHWRDLIWRDALLVMMNRPR